MTHPDAGDDRTITVSHLIRGPRTLVFQAFTTAHHLGRWWGPTGFTTTTRSFAFEPGGVWEFTMHAPDGTDFPNHVEWQEIDPPRLLIYRQGARPDDPDAFVTTVTLTDQEGQTGITLRTVFATKEQRDLVVERFGALEGGRQTLARLAEDIETRAG